VTTEIPAELQRALAQRYEIATVLGRGGMATVYRATDRKHRRDVAIKVLLPGLAAFLGTERFLKEIEIAARLTHPHILALYDSGEAGGFLYYVMPFVEGGSLRQRLEPGRPIAMDQALGIAAGVVNALSYAHRMGVVHRDIKPENILFSQGHPIVADFGIAKAISTAGGANLTRTGFPLGTPGYMSPEQAAGLVDLDERTDVYSLAVVIYEMLLGEPPGRWPSDDAVRAGRFFDAPARHRARLAELGPTIEYALVRGLATQHVMRTATPDGLITELMDRRPRRRYDGAEVQAIVKRASEMEAATPTASGALTIGGVEALAAEVGIPPATVRAAAVDTPIRVNRFWGGPTVISIERVIEGEVPESEFPAMVEETRRMLQSVGQVSQLGRSFTWSGSPAGLERRVQIAVTARGGWTRITVHESLSSLVGGIYGGIGGAMGGGLIWPVMVFFLSGLHTGPLSLLAIVPGWLGLTYGAARKLYKHNSTSRVSQLVALADRLESLARELIPIPRALKAE
jgi:serine/threonine protein kinase